MKKLIAVAVAGLALVAGVIISEAQNSAVPVSQSETVRFTISSTDAAALMSQGRMMQGQILVRNGTATISGLATISMPVANLVTLIPSNSIPAGYDVTNFVGAQFQTGTNGVNGIAQFTRRVQ